MFFKASVPDGIAPYVTLLCVFMLANFAVVLCGAMYAQSEAMNSAVIVVTNMGVSIFMFTVGPLPAIQQHMWAPAPVWNSTFWTVLGCELAVLRHRLRPALLSRIASPRFSLEQVFKENKNDNYTAPDTRARTRRGARLRPVVGRGLPRHPVLRPGMPPGIWAMVDNSPSQFLTDAGFVTHVFRMSLFFFIAGFFGRMLYHKLGARGFWANRGKRIAVPLVVGWIICVPLIMYIWGIGLAKMTGGAPSAAARDAARLSSRSRICGSSTSCCCCISRSSRSAPSC